MLDATEIAIFVALGLAFAGGLAALALWARRDALRFAAYALIAVCFLYVGFAFRAENANSWIGVEMTGVAVFGSLALASLIGSPWFLAAGLALHPVFAIAVHYFGAGAAFAPGPFVLANTSFDVALALYVVFLILRPGEKSVANPPAKAGVKTGRGRAK